MLGPEQGNRRTLRIKFTDFCGQISAVSPHRLHSTLLTSMNIRLPKGLIEPQTLLFPRNPAHCWCESQERSRGDAKNVRAQLPAKHSVVLAVPLLPLAHHHPQHQNEAHGETDAGADNAGKRLVVRVLCKVASPTLRRREQQGDRDGIRAPL
jgi:hypothetical protein